MYRVLAGPGLGPWAAVVCLFVIPSPENWLLRSSDFVSRSLTPSKELNVGYSLGPVSERANLWRFYYGVSHYWGGGY